VHTPTCKNIPSEELPNSPSSKIMMTKLKNERQKCGPSQWAIWNVEMEKILINGFLTKVPLHKYVLANFEGS
jgi:hypothetical protein